MSYLFSCSNFDHILSTRSLFTTCEWKNALFNSYSSFTNWNSFELQTSIIRTSQYSKHKNGKITAHLHVNEKSAWIACTGRCTRTLALALTKTAQTSLNQLSLQLRGQPRSPCESRCPYIIHCYVPVSCPVPLYFLLFQPAELEMLVIPSLSLWK